MKRISYKHSYFTISAADMLLFILLCAYLTLDWADLLYSYFSNDATEINLQIWLRSACEIAVTVLLVMWVNPVCALKLNIASLSNIILSIFLALFLYTAMTVLISYLNYIALLNGLEPVANDVGEAMSKASFIEEFLFFCVLAPICEEFLFRGAILNAYRRKIGFAAIFVSSLFFGLMHVEVFSVLNGFVVGFALGYVYLKTNSMWCPVLMHMAYNLFAFTLIPDVFIVNLPWTIGIFDQSLMTFAEPGYLTYVWGIAAIGVFASILILRKISALNSGNKIIKCENYVPSVCENVIAGVVVMLLAVRIAAFFAGWLF